MILLARLFVQMQGGQHGLDIGGADADVGQFFRSAAFIERAKQPHFRSGVFLRVPEQTVVVFLPQSHG